MKIPVHKRMQDHDFKPLKVTNRAIPGAKKGEWIQVWDVTLGCVCGAFTEIPAIDLRPKQKEKKE